MPQPTASPRLQEKLIPSSESRSVILAESVSYHNVQKTGTQEKLKWRSGWVSLQHNIHVRHDESRAARSHNNVRTAIWDVWNWQFVRRARAHGDQTTSRPPILNSKDKILGAGKSSIAEKKSYV